MAQIHNSDISRRIIDEAKLQLSVDVIPTQLAEKVVPVLVSNPKRKKRLLVYSDANSRTILNDGLYVPVGKRWRVLNAFIYLTTDATVADRLVSVEFYNVSNVRVWNVKATAIQEATKGEYYNFAPNILPAESPTDYHWLPLNQNLILHEGAQIWFGLANLQAGDTLRMSLLIEETSIIGDKEEDYKITAY